jgi:ribonuclease HII
MERTVGIDEAGRGPLAGPVAIGLVCAPHGFSFRRAFPKLNDSKRLSEPMREKLFDRLESYAAAGTVEYVVLLRSAQEIDERGISIVVREAIEEGLGKLLAPGEGKVWLDGSLSAPEAYEQETVIGGDG